MCSIKGSKINKQEIQELMDKIELTPKKDALCSTLSGGQKRKLCIALALIGGSQIILLDEPTSGMDAMARRKLWEFLKNYKKDKIMLLTTHYLDEAEYLGDRIGIMSDGHFLCSGTSSFLKSKYPCGFNLNLLINQERFNEDYKLKLFENVAKYDPKAENQIEEYLKMS
jgi:ATP-binding cassette subfamily A (ABC1) protein 3